VYFVTKISRQVRQQWLQQCLICMSVESSFILIINFWSNVWPTSAPNTQPIKTIIAGNINLRIDYATHCSTFALKIKENVLERTTWTLYTPELFHFILLKPCLYRTLRAKSTRNFVNSTGHIGKNRQKYIYENNRGLYNKSWFNKDRGYTSW
jgi:hypothetical protein